MTMSLTERDLLYALKAFEQLLPKHPDPKLLAAIDVLRARVKETSWPERGYLSVGYTMLVEGVRSRLDEGKAPTRQQGAALMDLMVKLERERIEERLLLSQARETSDRLGQLIEKYNRLQRLLDRAGLDVSKPPLRAGWGYQINGGEWVGAWSEDWQATEAGLAALLGRDIPAEEDHHDQLRDG